MKHYSPITMEQRYQICGLKQAGLEQPQSTRKIDRHKPCGPQCVRHVLVPMHAAGDITVLDNLMAHKLFKDHKGCVQTYRYFGGYDFLASPPCGDFNPGIPCAARKDSLKSGAAKFDNLTKFC
jgi:hypothetical protein